MTDGRSQVAIGPAEFAVLVKIINTVVAEPGFNPDEVQRDMLRRYIIARFRDGMTDTAELLAHCQKLARQHFLP